MTTISNSGRRYGWHPSRPSVNRAKLSIPLRIESALPTEVDLRDQFPPVYDQGQLGSCVDNATASLIERQLMQTKYKWQMTPSRLFAYYNARSLEGTTDSDSGSTVADGIAAVQQFGICPEAEADGTTPGWEWPYDINQYTQKPPDQCYKDAVLHKALKSQTVNLDRSTVLNALALGNPFCFGFTVHQSFESQEMAQTGIMHVPQAFDFTDPEIGGHAVVAVGYSLNKPMGNQGVVDWALVRNSWGAWGYEGHFWMPLDQILCNPNVASDAHTIDLVGV